MTTSDKAIVLLKQYGIDCDRCTVGAGGMSITPNVATIVLARQFMNSAPIFSKVEERTCKYTGETKLYGWWK